MPHNMILNPWRINDSDSEDEINNQFDQHIPLPPRSSRAPTPMFLGRRSEPKTLNWEPVINQDKYKGKLSYRKTAPSYEKAPSDHKPIFSGPPSLKSSIASMMSMLTQDEEDRTIVTSTPETSLTSPPTINSNFNPILLIQENLNKFIYTYIPKDYPSFIHCCLQRDRSGIQKGFFPTFYLHIERPGDGKKIFLLAARKVAKVNRQSEYFITNNIETLSEKSGGEGCVGKLRGNGLMGTEYTLYDNGKSPNKYGNKHSNNKNGLRRELAAIIYHTNILGFKGPRQINAIIPELEHDIQPTKNEKTILDQWRDRRFSYLLQLRNRSPQYDEDKKAHMLQFTGNSVVQPSIKNFQMVIETENHQEEVVMQFGRINNDIFTCDYRYPLSAIQAFGIALSSFDSRFTRE